MVELSDIRRISFLLTGAILGGWLFGNIALAVAFALGCYALWLHGRLRALLHWIQDRKRVEAPDPPGVFENICREIDFLRERHKRRKKKLGNYLKQFRQATRALPDSTVVIDEQGAVKWANVAAEDVLGIRWPEDGNQRITNLVRVPELVEFVESAEFDSSIDIPSPTNPAVQLNVRLTPSGNRQRLFVARDVSQLYRVNQIRSDFVANVSHELKTPLTVLRGYLENMSAQRDACPPGWETALDLMSDNVNRMQAVVEDLLMLSKLEQNDTLENPGPVAVSTLINEIHGQTQSTSRLCDHMFMLQLDTELLIKGSKKELYSCFSNLIFNAINYTPERGVIEISWYQDETGAHLSVRDSGIGIGAEHLDRLTERFYRVDSSRARPSGGTGLGLAIVKHVLTRHGASLHIESTPGEGSLFRCDFPASVVVETRRGLEANQAG